MNQKEIVDRNFKTTREGESSLSTKISKSIFQSIIVACQRHKQLKNGADPRVLVASLKTKNTRIAIEEVKQGLIHYTAIAEPFKAKA